MVALGQDQSQGPEPAAGDREELREIFREYDLRTAPEKPGVAIYFRDLMYAVVGAFMDRLGPGLVGLVAAVARVGAQVLFLLALGLLAAILARTLYNQYQRRRARALRQAPVTATRASMGEEPDDPGSDGWAEELRRRLAAGEVAPACAALWWWLARTLMPGRVESSWTSRELLTRAGRTDLRAPAARLDRMIYGADAPTVKDVQGLWLDFEASTGQPATASTGQPAAGSVGE